MKKFTLYLHSILGLGSAAFVLIAALTGAVLVFEEEISVASKPHLHHVEPLGERLPWGDLTALVYATYPETWCQRFRASADLGGNAARDAG